MKLLLALLLLFPTFLSATPLTLTWDPVTTNTDGTPVGSVIYRLYKRTPTGPFLFMASRITTGYTWTNPQVGDWTFVVRALSKNGESDNSNELHVVVDGCWEIIP